MIKNYTLRQYFVPGVILLVLAGIVALPFIWGFQMVALVNNSFALAGLTVLMGLTGIAESGLLAFGITCMLMTAGRCVKSIIKWI